MAWIRRSGRRPSVLTLVLVAALVAGASISATILWRRLEAASSPVSSSSIISSSSSSSRRGERDRDSASNGALMSDAQAARRAGPLSLEPEQLAIIGILEEVRAYPGYNAPMANLVRRLHADGVIQHSADMALLGKQTLQRKYGNHLSPEQLTTLQRWSRIASIKLQAIQGADLCACSECSPQQPRAQQKGGKEVGQGPERGGAARRQGVEEQDRKKQEREEKEKLRKQKREQEQQQEQQRKAELERAQQVQQEKEQQEKEQQRREQGQRQEDSQGNKAAKPRSNVVADIVHRGMANAHYWFNVCGSKLDILRKHPNFPTRANHLDALRRLDHSVNSPSFGARVFGFLIPPKDGTYVFAVSGDNEIELRVSPTADMADAALVAYARRETPRGRFDVLASQKSKPMQLRGNTPYAFEVLHKQADASDHMQVAWSIDGAAPVIIEGDALALYDTKHTHEDNYLDEINLVDMAEESPHNYNQAELQRIPYVPDEDVDDALPSCDYSPSWVYKRALARYEAANKYLVRTSHLFPTFDSKLPRGEGLSPAGDREFHPTLAPNEAQDLVQSYLRRVNEKRKAAGKETFQLKRIHQVEAKKPRSPRDGTRYLVEIDVVTETSSKPRRISRYVVQTYRRELCYPTGWKWNKDAEVHVLIPVKNQAPWIIHLIKNIKRLTAVMHDPRITLVVVDFNSEDADVKQLLEISGIKFIYVRENTPFSRALGIQKGIDAVKDPNAVAFACDLHLEIPPSVIENCRKHTIRNRLGYAPVVIRLGCGSHPGDVAGFWEQPGYGLFAMTKADWDKIGGMNTREFKNKWGGEDWEMLDRVFANGYDADRLKEHQFYHYYHTRAGMWNSNLNINLPTNVEKQGRGA